MVQTTEKNLSESRSTSLTTPFVEVTKEFNAPVEIVWKTFTDPESIKQWYGPEDFTCPSAKSDFREEGKYLYAMKDPGGTVTYSTGTFLEIFPNQLIVCTDQFADEKGNVIKATEAGMPSEWRDADKCLISVKLEKLDDDHTRLSLVHEGIPEAAHDDCVEGWTSTLNKMKKIVEKH